MYFYDISDFIDHRLRSMIKGYDWTIATENKLSADTNQL